MSSPSDSNLPPAIFIMGPTASGKTDLAVELKQRLPVELISVDSALIYRGMDIGTAKPDAATLALAPHHLIDICDPSETYSAASFRNDALQLMNNITQAGKIPLLVGGTMLYFRALQYGLSNLPDANPAIRARLEEEAKTHGWQRLHDRLNDIDPISAARIHPNDPQRLQRALEVYELTGKPLSQLHQENQQDACPYDVLKFALLPNDRAWLHERIALRFEMMLKQGLLDEVKQLHQRGDLHTDLPAVRAVGYRQAWDYLDGNIDYNMMMNRGIVATRQLAKRQITWLRSEKNIYPLDAQSNNLSSVLNRIKVFMDR